MIYELQLIKLYEKYEAVFPQSYSFSPREIPESSYGRAESLVNEAIEKGEPIPEDQYESLSETREGILT